MKPLSNQHAYTNLVKSTKTFLLLLSGGIVLFILIMLLQLFSYFSQSASINATLPEVPKNAHVLLAPPLKINAASKPANSTDSIKTIVDAMPPVTEKIDSSEKESEKPAVLHVTTKKSILSKADNSFLEENEIKNSDIVKELSQVVEMHEFHFKHGSFQLGKHTSMDKLDSSLQKCIEAPDTWSKIIILGFTDNRGSKIVNVKLGMKRAEVLKAILVKKEIPAEKITVASFGQELPIGSNKTESGRAMNRRVEFNLLGTGL